MLSAFLGITDNNWFDYLRRNQITDEVNFWVPSAPPRKHVEPGSLWLLKLHSPLDFIAGAGVFMHYSVLPLQMAWDAFGIRNGVPTLAAFRTAIMRYKRPGTDSWNTDVGCAVLDQVVYLPRELWVRCYTGSVVSGKHMASADDQTIVQQVLHNLELTPSTPQVHALPFYSSDYTPQYALREVRQGQGTFRVEVTDAYHRQCAVSREHSLPVLEAAHIIEWSDAISVRELKRQVERQGLGNYTNVTVLGSAAYVETVREAFSNTKAKIEAPFVGHRIGEQMGMIKKLLREESGQSGKA